LRILYFVLLMFKSMTIIAMNNTALINCTYTPDSQIPPSFNYYSTILQTAFSALQVVFFPTNFLGDWYFYHEHHNRRVKEAEKKLKQVRDEQISLRDVVKKKIGNLLEEIEEQIMDEELSEAQKAHICHELHIMEKVFKKLAQSDEPTDAEVRGQ
jgi:hypothetical protein